MAIVGFVCGLEFTGSESEPFFERGKTDQGCENDSEESRFGVGSERRDKPHNITVVFFHATLHADRFFVVIALEVNHKLRNNVVTFKTPGLSSHGTPSIFHRWESMGIDFKSILKTFIMDFRDNGFPIDGKSILIDGDPRELNPGTYFFIHDQNKFKTLFKTEPVCAD